MVRLKEGFCLLDLSFSEIFQFQSGAVKSSKVVVGKFKRFFNFNSKVVRLKALIIQVVKVSEPHFNSKVVRLKERYKNVVFSFSLLFQFQSGAVKSTKADANVNLQFEFQFQSGAVKRLKNISNRRLLYYFNSKVVRLKAILPFLIADQTPISIPKWCG